MTCYYYEPGSYRPGSYIKYDKYNCEDFENWEEAQEVYEYYGGIENDIHHLDRDHDGLPCESLK